MLDASRDRLGQLHRPSRTSSRSALESLETGLKPYWIGPVFRSTRQRDTGAVKALQTCTKHRAVRLVEQPTSDVNHAVGIDAEHVAVEREVMDRAQREPVND